MEGEEEQELELLIKWTNMSYFHLDWIFKSDFELLGQGVGARKQRIDRRPCSAIGTM